MIPYKVCFVLGVVVFTFFKLLFLIPKFVIMLLLDIIQKGFVDLIVLQTGLQIFGWWLDKIWLLIPNFF